MPIDQYILATIHKEERLESILQYLQLQVREGRFCNLRRLQVSLHCIPGVATKTAQDAMRSVLMLAGSWELHSCHIRGCFTLSAAIALLPSCLQHMALSSVGPEQGYGPEQAYMMMLNKLQRFSDLHTLQLGSDRSGSPGILYLQWPLLPLSTLQIHGNLILRNLDVPCQSLPKLHHLSCTVNGDQLQHFLSMPQLVYANLKVYCDDDDDDYDTLTLS